jgi:hypothetical protein
MPDNVTLPGTGAVVATDDIGGFQHQRVKFTLGADGVNDGDVSAANPMPVQEVGGAMSLLTRIVNLLMSPMGFDRSLSRQRVTAILESGTVTAVTTVATVTGVTNIDGRNGAMLINQTNLSAWANCVRARIT